MSVIDNYLTELFKRKEKPKEKVIPTATLLKASGFDIVDSDRGLPNPYNFKRLKLAKITKQDLKNAEVKWQESIKKGYNVEGTFLRMYKDYHKLMVTIVDGSKRVGIVGWAVDNEIFYVTWIPGKNYATAGLMKLLNDKRYFHQIFITADNKVYPGEFYITAHKNNKASLKVAKNLKPREIKRESNKIYHLFEAPLWWNKNKFLKHYLRE